MDNVSEIVFLQNNWCVFSRVDLMSLIHKENIQVAAEFCN